MIEITGFIPSTFVLSFNLVGYVFSRFWNSRGVCSLVFGCYSIACFCKLLHAVICIIVRHSLLYRTRSFDGISLSKSCVLLYFSIADFVRFRFLLSSFLDMLQFVLIEVVCLACFRHFLESFFLFINSGLIFSTYLCSVCSFNLLL